MPARGLIGIAIAVVLLGCGSKDNPDLGSGAGSGAGKGSSDGGGGASAGSADGGTVRDASHGSLDDAGGGNAETDAGASAATDAGGNAETDAGTGGACQGPLLPMAVGNAWTYVVTHPVDGTSMKTTTVADRSTVGGTGPNAATRAFHVITEKLTGTLTDRTESWQGVLDDGTVVRLRELSFAAGVMTPNGEDFWDPHKLRVDNSPGHTEDGASWHEQYTETKVVNGVTTPAARDDVWTVEGVDVPCGPVGGVMYRCLQLSKNKDGATTGKKTYWYAPCVGKVREEGAQSEALESFTVQ